jgi:hypothetical protein
MRDFCSDFLPAVFDILELSRQKPQVKKMYKKAHLATTGSFERSLITKKKANAATVHWHERECGSLSIYFFPVLLNNPHNKLMTKRIRKIQNNIFAAESAPAATPPNP